MIRSKRGRFLAIATENAPRKGTDGRRISPSTFPEHRFGPLRFVPRQTGPSLLVVDGLRDSYSRQTGELRGFRRAAEGARRSGQGLATVPMRSHACFTEISVYERSSVNATRLSHIIVL